MADKSCRDGNPRRPSFRKTQSEATLPPEYLDNLEQKRRQLDESIHKYIAAKEREYKGFERDLRVQFKIGQHDCGKDSEKERPLLGLTADAAELAFTDRNRAHAVGRPGTGNGDRLERESELNLGDDGVVQGSARQTFSGLTSRRESQERDREFVGVFTPAFLPALANATAPILERTSSAPAVSNSTSQGEPPTLVAVIRANSDTTIPVKANRPSQLQLAHRTSSSGSSVDGKLASALKSPTQPAKPKRKRVSLAVGDAIVAPTDSVPSTMSNNTIPSHSKTRAPIFAPENGVTGPHISPADLPSSPPQNVDTKVNLPTGRNGDISLQSVEPAIPAPSSKPDPPVKISPKLDPDGDLFDLEDEELNDVGEDAAFRNPFGIEDDVVGRIERPSASPTVSGQSPREHYDENAGVVLDSDEDDGQLGFAPSSSMASQQPTSPGFRRPSVSMDPVYTGSDWTRAEHDAVVNDVYGSSYARPSSRGSFTAGSLGESYMARNSEKLMKNRAGQDQSQVRT